MAEKLSGISGKRVLIRVKRRLDDREDGKDDEAATMMLYKANKRARKDSVGGGKSFFSFVGRLPVDGADLPTKPTSHDLPPTSPVPLKPDIGTIIDKIEGQRLKGQKRKKDEEEGPVKEGQKTKAEDKGGRIKATPVKKFRMIDSQRNVSLSQIVMTHDGLKTEADDVTGTDYDVITLEATEEEVVSCNGVPAEKTKSPTFVYDLYYGHAAINGGGAVDFGGGDGKANNGGGLWKACFGGGGADDAFDVLMSDDDDSSDDDLDDEDSNAEDNWRNEYPDEEDDDDDDESSDDDDGVEDKWRHHRSSGYADHVVSSGGSSLSGSDEDEEDRGLVYSLSPEDQQQQRRHRHRFGVDDDDDEEVADRHGSAYARFKSKVLRDLDRLNVHDDDSDHDDDVLDEDDRVALEDGL